MLHIYDEYTSYCFDEACLYIESRIKDGEEPEFNVKSDSVVKPHYSSASQMYEAMGYKNNSFVKNS